MSMPFRSVARSLARFFQSSLLIRIVSSFFLLSTVIVAFLTVFGFSFLARSARGRLIDQLEAIAAIKVTTLNTWVDEQRRHAVSFMVIPDLRRGAASLCSAAAWQSAAAEQAHARLDRIFSLLLAEFPEVHAISVLSAEGGRVVFSTQASQEGRYRLLDSEFTEGMRATSIQSVHPSPISLEPTMSISTPVRDSDGRTVGVLVVSLNLDSMDRIIQERTGLGSTGEAYLVDRYSTFVSGSRFGRVNYPRGVHSAGIDAALRGQSGSASYVNYAGVPVIGSYRWIPQQDLALLVEVPQSDALQPAARHALLLVGIGLSLVMALAFGVYFLARRLAEPILAIQQAAMKVSAGDLSATAPVVTRDEVGDLAEAFNRMTSRVRDLYQELEQREEHFRSLIESSMDMVVVIGADGVCGFASPSLERVLGYTAADMAARPLLSLVHPQDLEKCRTALARLAAGRDSIVTGLTGRIQHKDGSWHTLEASARNLLDHPAIRGYVVNARDISERVQLEDKLAQAQKMEAVGRLAGGVAHDFNNLLTVVLGYSDELAACAGLDEEARANVAEIGKAASRAADLTQQLLAYSRKQVLQPRLIDLNALLAGMTGMLARLIGEDVRVVMRPAADLRPARADPSQIVQVVMNLAANARDAMPRGGTLVIETAPAFLDEEYCSRFPDLAPGKYVMLSVSDTGTGMDEDVRRQLFEPFFTTKDVGKGTGLGLATVYGIVRQSGGHITVDSEVGRGSTFRVFLPAAGPETPAQAAQHSDASRARGAETILVLEDEEPVRRMIANLLERSGYTVHAAARPPEALRKAEEIPRVDLLVTDVVLPGMNGREVAEIVRRRCPAARVLFISGYASGAMDLPGDLSREAGFLMKPFTPAVLTRKVREILDRR